MKTKLHTLASRALAYAIALAEGWINFKGGAFTAHRDDPTGWLTFANWEPIEVNPDRRNIADSIIDREKISVIWDNHCEVWAAYYDPPGGYARCRGSGTTRREAAMRCWVLRKLGEEVDIPKELL